LAGELIDHIGILVPDLELAIQKWSAVLGYKFSPIVRYRTAFYSDHSNPEPHWHDTRVSFSREGPPYIELMSVAGTGTHGPAEVGVHHFGIRGIEDVPARIDEVRALGVGNDGKSQLEDGRVHLWFTEKHDLNGARLEFISTFLGPTVADDGSPLPIDPKTGRRTAWPIDSE
jgi:catechol 2,3-dioxygenase-like lactoylglutathione lyase family enzyme